MKIDKKILDKRLSGEYIAGFVHGDGGFSATLNERESKTSKRIFLQPTFTLTQHIDNKLLILSIKNKLNNVGSYEHEDKLIRYRIRSIKDFSSVVIPYFDKYQLKDKKLLIYIKIKFIVDKLLSIEDKWRWYSEEKNNKYNQLMLDLITISVNANERVNPSIKLKVLSKETQKKVLKNEISPEINEELNNYINNYNYNNDISIGFINGLFDSDGWITLGYRLKIRKSKTTNKIKKSINTVLEYGISSDILIVDILKDLKKIFLDKGWIKSGSNDNSITYGIGKWDTLLYVLPKLYDVPSYLDILDNESSSGSILKDSKIKTVLEILRLEKLFKETNRDEDIFERMLTLSYEIRESKLKKKETLESYIIRMKNKLCIK